MRILLPILLVAVWMLGGCARSPDRQFYTLRSFPSPMGAMQSQQPGKTIAIAALTIPETVDRNKMVTREPGTSRLEISDTHRWAEPLESEIAVVLADELARLTRGTLVSSPGQTAGSADPDNRIDLDITRFEGVLGMGVDVEANWTIRDGQSTQGRHGHARLREQVTGMEHEMLAAAYSRALQRLAVLIAKDIDSDLSRRVHSESTGA